MKTFIADLGAHHVTDFGPPHGDDDSVVSKGPRSKAALGDQKNMEEMECLGSSGMLWVTCLFS